MKGIYIVLLVLVVAASVLGCVGKKQTETSTNIVPQSETKVSPAQTASPAQTQVSGAPAEASSNGADTFGTESDIAAIDSIVNDSNMDISLSDSI
ncbi:Uncharacterised protein [uncultured archaeon]|nr:Uncharacterised protein [uncultured archaeon]